MNEKILSIEEIRTMNDEFNLPDEEGFYQYILEDDLQRMQTDEDYENFWAGDYYDDLAQWYEIEKEERRHEARFDGWIIDNGLEYSIDAHCELGNLFNKIDYYYPGGPCETNGYINSYECDEFFENIFFPEKRPDVKLREICEEYSIRKFEALKSLSPKATDEEIEKFLYLYECNSHKLYS